MTLYCPDFSSCRVLVAGDVMLDIYYWGDVGRISPEAPVPVVRVMDKSCTLGGAGNVALNLKGLGAQAILMGVRGDDRAGADMAGTLAEHAIVDELVILPSHPTTTKTRVLGQGQQLVRLDEEQFWEGDPEAVDAMATAFERLVDTVDVVILSDYGKGFFSAGMAEAFIARCVAAKVPVFVDPKGNDWSRYEGVTCITPNTREFMQACSLTVEDDHELEVQAGAMIRRLKLDGLLVTRGGKGMSLFTGDAPPIHIPTEAKDVFDVSGAGDTVISVMAAAMGAGMPVSEAAALANCAAGIVVQKVGTAPIDRVSLEIAVRGRQSEGPAKHFVLEDAVDMVAAWKKEQHQVVFTNGCFDLLHAGHIKLLHAAAREGDKLVVGINSDDSVRRLKGESRPVLPEGERAAILAAIGCVDMVIVFTEDTPLRLIDGLKPDVIVKGGDYTPETVVGRDLVESYGGRVCLVPLKDGVSTTNIIKTVSGS
ncbi:MAG: bifunctional D-glycero-beta-D-manno-heptose-7-phosphate kinase/D-glycero-beta-D-manno-heptose 1-phosphate adenylyltransferase HldE [Thermodesulfobacteriota bacterium]|nr:bifunctional D-glycero-beta-D-manno-heptose-7-phosphate kinase/D-glycero-beta-D-manno-heptose 1-phosphate adenylyltransferase HldE [Thermodesulfobacteriota bacterium]